MENYICGVVAAEGGLYKTPEFLKVQAICSRTYAMRNMGKFVREGFDLTDKVDCQVYHGIPKNLPGVEDAVLATAG
jgi:stage II sporulation protein D